MLNSGQALTFDDLISDVWGPGGGTAEMLRQLGAAAAVQGRERSGKSALHPESAGAGICVFVETVNRRGGSRSAPTIYCHTFVTRISRGCHTSRLSLDIFNVEVSMSILLEGISKRYAQQTVVNNVSLEVKDGEFFVLLGSSGSGKTTVLNIIAGLVGADEGRVSLHGRDVTHLPRRNVRSVLYFKIMLCSNT